MKDGDFDKLIGRYLEGECSENESRALLEAIESSDALRRRMARHLYHERSLADLMRQEQIEDVAAEVRDAGRWTLPTPMRWAAAAAALLLAVSIGWMAWPSNVEPVARLKVGGAGVTIERAGTRRAAPSGAAIYAGDILHTQGQRARIVYPDDTRLDLDNRTTARLDVREGAKRVSLKSGRLSANVAKQTPGAAMVLTTPEASTTVLGTKFSLTARSGASLLEVDEGRVRFDHQRKSVEVSGGHYALALSGYDLLHGDLARHVARWTLDEGAGQIGRDASDHGHGGVMVGVRWIDGARGRAVHFDGGASQMVVRDAPSLDAIRTGLSISAFVKRETGANAWQTLLARSTDHEDRLHYALALRQGVPVFSVTTSGGRKALFADQALPEGRWVHVAGTFDGERIRLYVDGRPIASAPHTGHFDIGEQPLWIGAAARDGRTVHRFRGGLDELRLDARALTDREIAELAGP